MAVDVVMPQMGESVAEGTIVRWLKSVGDSVDVDEPIFEITTDKVDAEIPSPVAGTLISITVQAGETVEVGTVVAQIGAAGEAGASGGTSAKEAAPAAAPVAAPAASAAETAPVAAPAVEKPRAEMTATELRQSRSTPVVRKIAAEHDVNIAAVAGTGLDGRVTRKDIEQHLATRAEAPAAAPAKAAPAAAAPAAAAPAAAAPAKAAKPSAGKVDLGIPMHPVNVGERDRSEPMSPMRRVISDRMSESKHYSAHVHTCFEVDFSRVDALRKKHKEAYAERGVKLTFTGFLAKAAVDALRAFPIVNSSHDGENVVYRGDINLGIAVALDWGLIVPVVKNADELSVLGLSRQIADLGGRAKIKKLKPDEVSGLTFSITNPGIFGSLWGTPIIPQPSVAILGVGTIEKRVKVVSLPDGSDVMAIRTCGFLTLGFDHRVIDGAVADQFMAHLKNALENFDEGSL